MNVDGLSLREKAAQLLFPRLGSNMPPLVRASEDLERFERLLDECPVGGLIVFNGAYPETTEALLKLQRRSTIPMLVSADMERGTGQQIRGATVFPHARAFSAAGDEMLLGTAASVHAREALAAGIQMTFSPVADVNRDPRNPIIATRSYGSDPEEAARYVRTFIDACRAEGLLTTAKHFPGHGNTSQDSHSELPVVPSSREDLEAFDLVPFRAAIEAGVDLIMTAHVLYPALDRNHPSTLSGPILRTLLRDEMGFQGAVITDSLLMGAIRSFHDDAASQAAALVRAGVDILLDVPEPVAASDGIVRAIEDGSLDEQLLDAAAGRVMALKEMVHRRAGGGFLASPTAVSGDDIVGADANAEVARRAARAAITVLEGRLEDLASPGPDGEGTGVTAVLIKPHRTRLDPDEEPFGRAFRNAYPKGEYRQINPDTDQSLLDDIQKLACHSRLVVLAVVVKPAAWHKFGLLPDQQRLAKEITKSCRSIVVSLGSPYVLEEFGDADARICAFSDVPVSQEAVVDFISGAGR